MSARRHARPPSLWLVPPVAKSVAKPAALQPKPAQRLVMSFTPGMACPGCAGGWWEIGRKLAECPRCGFAVDLPAEGGGKR